MALSKKQQDFLNKLAEDETLVYRGFIKRFILVNTHESKYKVGDYVKFSDPLSSVFGQRVKNFNGKIANVRILAGSVIDFKDICFQYEIHAIVNGMTFEFYAEERMSGATPTRKIHGRSDTDVNIIEKKSDVEQSIDVII